jgi:hypothetical protein
MLKYMYQDCMFEYIGKIAGMETVAITKHGIFQKVEAV